jgi:hypothetical protein
MPSRLEDSGLPARDLFSLEAKAGVHSPVYSVEKSGQRSAAINKRRRPQAPQFQRRIFPARRKINAYFRASNAVDGELTIARLCNSTVGVVSHSPALQRAQVPPLAHHSKEELVSALQQGINTSDEMKRQDLTLNARLPVLSVILASTLKK